MGVGQIFLEQNMKNNTSWKHGEYGYVWNETTVRKKNSDRDRYALRAEETKEKSGGEGGGGGVVQREGHGGGGRGANIGGGDHVHGGPVLNLDGSEGRRQAPPRWRILLSARDPKE